MNKPYRFFYTSHWIGSTAEAVQQQNFYFLKPLATAANEPAIFLAPQALPGNPNGTWDTSKNTDHVLFDDILAYVKENLCIDTTRVFATGFSFGGMMTYSLSVNHQKDIRAAVGIAPANYNIYVPTKTHQPIAWMQTTGMSDGTCPWVNGTSTTQGAKYIAIEHGTDNGCTVPATIPTWQSGDHVCYDFPGCRAEFPTKVCTFNGATYEHRQRLRQQRELDSGRVLEVLHAVLSRRCASCATTCTAAASARCTSADVCAPAATRSIAVEARMTNEARSRQ